MGAAMNGSCSHSLRECVPCEVVRKQEAYATAHEKEHNLWLELSAALLWLGASEETLSLMREWGTAFAELYKLNVNGHKQEVTK
jgi:hypothetical protein